MVPALPGKNNKADSEFHFVFPGTPLEIRKALSHVLTKLKPLALSLEEEGTVELVLAEVLNNIAEHAYCQNPNGLIELRIRPVAGKGLLCSICDTGLPMPNGEAPLGQPVNPNCQMQNLPEGGFGWFLIRDLTRDLAYSRKNEKNILSFRISVGQPEIQMN